MNINYRFDGKNFERAQNSSYGHAMTALASYRGQPFVTSGGYQTGNDKTEIFSALSQKWELTTSFSSM